MLSMSLTKVLAIKIKIWDRTWHDVVKDDDGDNDDDDDVWDAAMPKPIPW